MLRIRITPKETTFYRYTDEIHDNIVCEFCRHGLDGKHVVGHHAYPWTFAIKGCVCGKHLNRLDSLVISTSSAPVSESLFYFNFNGIFKHAIISKLSYTHSNVFRLLSPLLIKNNKKWLTDISDQQLSDVVNKRLSILFDRDIALDVKQLQTQKPTLIHLKENAFVIGMRPLLRIDGDEHDIALAYHSGIGEKTRNGFGCLEGVGL